MSFLIHFLHSETNAACNVHVYNICATDISWMNVEKPNTNRKECFRGKWSPVVLAEHFFSWEAAALLPSNALTSSSFSFGYISCCFFAHFQSLSLSLSFPLPSNQSSLALSVSREHSRLYSPLSLIWTGERDYKYAMRVSVCVKVRVCVWVSVVYLLDNESFFFSSTLKCFCSSRDHGGKKSPFFAFH